MAKEYPNDVQGDCQVRNLSRRAAKWRRSGRERRQPPFRGGRPFQGLRTLLLKTANFGVFRPVALEQRRATVPSSNPQSNNLASLQCSDILLRCLAPGPCCQEVHKDWIYKNMAILTHFPAHHIAKGSCKIYICT